MVGRVVVVGGGPGGLMAAEQLAMAGATVSLFERMPSVGRKFLLAGRGGLNLTHSESPERMLERYGDAAAVLAPVLRRFDPSALRAWAAGLGEPTFVGSSGRVFPESFRATPLLRAWLARLDDLGVEILTRRHWTGLTESGDGSITLEFRGPDDVTESVEADAAVLAMGGASWPKVGSDASWVDPIERLGIDVSPLRSANCGFVVPWTDVFRERFAGTPLKNVTLSLGERSARGEAMITATGVEGGVFYAIGAPIRDLVIETGVAVVTVDLQPDLDASEIAARAARRRPKDSSNTVLRKGVGLAPVAIGLMREATDNALPDDPAEIASLVKGVSLRLVGVEPVARAISTAGGVGLEQVDSAMMLRAHPGVFVVGEMLDWEAPTGGYLLQATFSTAVVAADGVVRWLTTRGVEG